MTKFHVSSVCGAFAASPVGTKVLDAGAFTAALSVAVEAHDTAGDRTPGQHFITLPGDALATVSAGVARRADVPEDGYVVRVHRGRADCYAARPHAAKATGLAAVVYTRDLARAHRVAQQMEVGICWVNSWFLRDLRTPFGGAKQSGIGREGGIHSLEFYTELRNICIRY